MNGLSASLLLLTLAFIGDVRGHGRLLEPPSRGSLWRFKNDPYITPYKSVIVENYNDNQLYCGGKDVQHRANGGKCGVCGDSYSAANKPHEAGGRYALGIITRYYDARQVIKVTVEITAQHKGYFEFRLCNWNNTRKPITKQCLDRHLLTFIDGSTRWYLPNHGVGLHHMTVRLPDDVTSCTQCVLQWRYRTGNSWGRDSEGVGLGHGDQEEFYGCSDIAIGIEAPDISSVVVNTPAPGRITAKRTTPSSEWNATPIKTTTRPRPSRSGRPQRPTPSRPGRSQRPTPSRPGRSQRPRPSRPGGPQKPPQSNRSLPEGQFKRVPKRCKKAIAGIVCFSCTSFYQCAHRNYAPTRLNCPLGTACNKNTNRCDFTYEVEGC